MAIRLISWIEVRDWIHGTFKTSLERSGLNLETGINAIIAEFAKITVHALLPSIFCTINLISGFDTVFIMWIMVVITAYLLHRNELDHEREQGLYSLKAWIRFGTLTMISLLGSLGNLPTIDMVSSEVGYGNSAWDFIKLFPGFQIKACQNVALYRLYLSAFGAIFVTVREIRKDRPKPKVVKKLKEDAGYGTVSATIVETNPEHSNGTDSTTDTEAFEPVAAPELVTPTPRKNESGHYNETMQFESATLTCTAKEIHIENIEPKLNPVNVDNESCNINKNK